MRKVAANLAIAEETEHITRTSAYLTLMSVNQYLKNYRHKLPLGCDEQWSVMMAQELILEAAHELAEEIRNV